MDFELEACTPTSRRSRPLAWLALASGLGLALFLFGSPGTASSPNTSQQTTSALQSASEMDHLTTSSILPASRATMIDLPNGHAQSLPLPQSERHLLILLLLICFAAMAAGVFGLWKRSWNEIIQRQNSIDHL